MTPPCKKCNDYRYRKRAQKWGTQAIHIRPHDIFERDGWRCWICGKGVVKHDSHNPLAPTLDHVIPLSAGGTHTPDNVKTAHRHCNFRREVLRNKEIRQYIHYELGLCGNDTY